jgi:hypothetical protein
LAAVIGEEDGENGTDGGGQFDREEDLVDAYVGNGIAAMLISVEESDSDKRAVSELKRNRTTRSRGMGLLLCQS